MLVENAVEQMNLATDDDKQDAFNWVLATLQSRVAAKIHSRQYSYFIKSSTGALVKVANLDVYLARLIDNHDKIKGNRWIELT
ncbi:hypothetical protein AB3K25_00600 [Leuconostoc sp. MS02]|uniref:Uncharacterized protein n=1 Tax=Leuconostoc aquikimchii TaxID=3236804 RepID=A0ABV3S5F9_9LACO